MSTHKIFKNLLSLGLIVTAIFLSACKDKNVDDEDEGGGPGGGGGSGNTSGGSLIFDGTGEHLVATHSWYTGDFTICLWMQPSSITGNTLLSMSNNNDKYWFLSFDGSQIRFWWESANDSDSQISASQTFTAGTKYHVCVSGDHNASGTTSRVYVNGSQRGSENVSTTAVAGTLAPNLSIGHDPFPTITGDVNEYSDPFAGTMDNLIIWDTVLDANAILQVYSSGGSFDPHFAFSNYTTSHVNGLKSWYLMGDHAGDTLSTSGPVIHDELGNDDATPVNFEENDFGVAL